MKKQLLCRDGNQRGEHVPSSRTIQGDPRRIVYFKLETMREGYYLNSYLKNNVFISGRKSKTNLRHLFYACTQQMTSTAVSFLRHTFVFAVDFILSPFFQFESCC